MPALSRRSSTRCHPRRAPVAVTAPRASRGPEAHAFLGAPTTLILSPSRMLTRDSAELSVTSRWTLDVTLITSPACGSSVPRGMSTSVLLMSGWDLNDLLRVSVIDFKEQILERITTRTVQRGSGFPKIEFLLSPHARAHAHSKCSWRPSLIFVHRSRPQKQLVSFNWMRYAAERLGLQNEAVA